MAKFLVLGGAGAEGEVFSRDLVNSEVDEVVLADYNINKAKQLAGKLNKVGKTKVSAIRVDANDYDEMVKTFKEENSDIICNLIGPYYKYVPLVVKSSIR